MNHHNTQQTTKEPFTPWHREPWAWYILIVLLVTFCWGGVQLYTAFTYQDSVVIADYYKKGKAINLDRSRLQAARNLDIQIDLTIDELIGEVRVQVHGRFQTTQPRTPSSSSPTPSQPSLPSSLPSPLQEWPDQLKLSFLSPVFADQDRFIELRRSVSGAYVGQMKQAIAGRYYLQLETLDEQIPEAGYQSGWKISTEAIIEPGKPISLSANEAT